MILRTNVYVLQFDLIVLLNDSDRYLFDRENVSSVWIGLLKLDSIPWTWINSPVVYDNWDMATADSQNGYFGALLSSRDTTWTYADTLSYQFYICQIDKGKFTMLNWNDASVTMLKGYYIVVWVYMTSAICVYSVG